MAADDGTEFEPARFDAMVLYIAQETKDRRDFGRTKLAKVLFYSDFDVYRDEGRSLTGATYKRMPFGPFPRELEDAERRLSSSRQVVLDHDKDQYEEKRMIPRGPQPDLTRWYQGWQVSTVDGWIEEIASATARRISDLSHRHPGWRLALEGADIPYGTALLPGQDRPTGQDRQRAERVARERGWLGERGWTWERPVA